MANVIVNNIQVNFDPSVSDVAKQIVEMFDVEDQFESAPLSGLYENSEPTREWWENNVGAKWARIQDMDLDLESGELTLNIESAWSEVDPFVHRLMEMFNNECVIFVLLRCLTVCFIMCPFVLTVKVKQKNTQVRSNET